MYKFNKNFKSQIDVFLETFDKGQKLSPSQIKEIKKYERIYKLRDTSSTEEPILKIWESF